MKRSSPKKGFIYGCRYIPISLIALYQLCISPFWSPSCRFYPTCSAYSRHAYQKYGILKGSYLTLIRIFKCHPFHPGGYDPLV